MTGIPQIFWDFTHSEEELNEVDSPYPIYKNLNLFVAKSVETLLDETKATQLSKDQFNDVVRNRNMAKNVQILEKKFLEIADKKLLISHKN